MAKFRDELLWQEYARHLYARVGTASRKSLRFAVDERTAGVAPGDADSPWVSEALCLESSFEELMETGWLTNQTRMWLASHWAVRAGLGWRDGEDLMFRHLLDGSRAANRLGWQWTVGALTGKAYGFSGGRWRSGPRVCAHGARWAELYDHGLARRRRPRAAGLADPGCAVTMIRGIGRSDDRATPGAADVVWLTAELERSRPRCRGHPDLPVVFVFDEPLLRRLRLSSNRLVFLAQSLAELSTRGGPGEVQLWRGDPVTVLQDRRLATTFRTGPGLDVPRGASRRGVPSSLAVAAAPARWLGHLLLGLGRDAG